MQRAKTPWDAFPDARTGKMDAESCGLAAALAHPNVELRTSARVERLIMAPDGRRIAGVECVRGGERSTLARRDLSCWPPARSIQPRCCSGPRRAALPIVRDPVGRHFMNHNASAVLAIDPRVVNDSVYQKTSRDQ